MGQFGSSSLSRRPSTGSNRQRQGKLDGTLYNPNNYPHEIVWEILDWIAEEKRQRKADAIRRGVATRKRRRELKINEIAMALIRGDGIGSQMVCACCKKVLGDPESIERGIGPECWQHVLDMIERIQRRKEA
jgi:hypothetical protein